MPNVVCIAGAGPAGLTAAYELIKAGIKPVVIEAILRLAGSPRRWCTKAIVWILAGTAFLPNRSE